MLSGSNPKKKHSSILKTREMLKKNSHENFIRGCLLNVKNYSLNELLFLFLPFIADSKYAE